MNYRNPELIERLAGEYVLGTLQGGARRRFEQLMTDSYRVRAVVWEWETQIAPLAAAVAPVTPPRHLWDNVRAGIRPARPGAAERWRDRVALWRGLSLAAGAAALMLAVVIGVRAPPTAAPEYVAVFNDEQAQAVWLVRADLDTGRIAVKAINARAAAADQAYELWMLPGGGAAPRSLGLLPAGRQGTEQTLSPALLALLRGAQGLAVSLEPAGGSPTGLPTGPVVFQAPLLSL